MSNTYSFLAQSLNDLLRSWLQRHEIESTDNELDDAVHFALYALGVRP